MLEFAQPFAFLMLPLPLLVYFLVPEHKERVSSVRFPFFRKIASAAGKDPTAGSVVVSRSLLQIVSATATWCLLVCALAQPTHVGDPIVQEKAARGVMLAIDISGSMDQIDFPSADGERAQRLDAVKRVVGDFISARDGDRVALIIFGSKAYVQAPFTEDLSSVKALLDQTEVGMAGPHTVIGDAIGLAIKTFQASQIDQRLLILLSDGSDTGSRMASTNAARIAANDGIEIITIGVGDPEGSGEQRLDEQSLIEIAEAGGGRYYFANDEDALVEIYTRIDALAPREVETASYRPRDPLGHYFFAGALLIGLFALLTMQLASLRRRSA
ncbi:VWA domain-containing protein [Roseibium sp. MMSF_3544]|uniref:VWA domain-containing protein n=1 Tax=unclassified Roseibium TaxID=2629323 RepID=UPI00273FBED2|nr:VWA domain-containing protein [Roseibium sp. MMSF_3544]